MEIPRAIFGEREDILNLLWAHLPQAYDDLEASHILKTIDFIKRTPCAFERQHETLGHVGASAVVVSHDHKKILLSQHTVLKTYSFFGNHCDGSINLPAIALQRVAQDAGPELSQSCQWQSGWLDVDVHYVPPHQRKHGEKVPAHLHYDMALLFYVEATQVPGSEQARWMDMREASSSAHVDTQFQRILAKLAALPARESAQP